MSELSLVLFGGLMLGGINNIQYDKEDFEKSQEGCHKVKIINKTNTWIEVDNQNMYVAGVRCVYHTQGRSPCLKTFTKTKDRAYRAICTWRKR